MWDGPPSPLLPDGEDPCRWLNTGFLGTLDGAPFDATYPGGVSMYGPAQEVMQLDGGGLIAVYGPATFEQDGEVPMTLAWLRFPSDGESPTGWFCTEAPSSATQVGLAPPGDTSSVRFTMGALHAAPSCPSGASVDGTLSIDTSGDLTGSIEGHPISQSFSGEWLGPGPRLFDFVGGGLLGFTSEDPASVFFILPPGSFDPGALYCAKVLSAGRGDGIDTGTYGDLRRVGTCAEQPPVDGTLAVCAS